MASESNGESRRRRADSSDYLKHFAKASNPNNDPQDIEGQGWGQSFHFCRYPRGREPMAQAMARHEHFMAKRLEIKPGMKVLDVGCGIGGPAKEIATFTDCKVIGLNVNAHQIEVGKDFAKKEGVGEDVLEFVEADFMKLPFPDNTFDVVYVIEATVHAPSLVGVYTEIYRVLKPGGRFGVYEWVMMADKFDPGNPQHVYLRAGMERGNGIACIRTSAEASDAIKVAGFTLEVAENLAEHEDPLPWWYFCDGETKYAQSVADWFRVVRMTKPGRVGLDIVIRLLELAGVARKGTAKMAKEMIHGGDCIAEAGKQHMFTPMYFMLGLKPANRAADGN
ncbi:S-adenosyl-L-methionine-dependent methyltransferase [Aaosphaeria arxii CBS 175.79]|uniref:Sterol 24-C-methyltransferase n=1 Tax=Aaosphaeria arxii CBS 175.79 TaxID=1450172 RepID=A0A6A5XI07_9PLEO|nr:S-adenosyl-L-methionine-dependent methyltransferase [Aaosphaeria arxii CBS 175.79]KAF2012752.1 S-adenosyl-L-methionine-dependent methyltransferase [Aaosphaeria arxii CBS 175.79]